MTKHNKGEEIVILLAHGLQKTARAILDTYEFDDKREAIMLLTMASLEFFVASVTSTAFLCIEDEKGFIESFLESAHGKMHHVLDNKDAFIAEAAQNAVAEANASVIH